MEPVNEKRWIIRDVDPAVAERLAGELAVAPLLARLLSGRGVADADSGRRFLAATLADIRDPLLLRGMSEAVERLGRARHLGETVCVYGDYDVDGITATAMLVDFLRAAGFSCFYHIPHRLDDGYGLSAESIGAVAAQGARVIVTVDCGISAVAEAAYAASLGIDLIITDHHLPGPELPLACAVIDPLRPSCPYPFKALAGVGVAFNLLIALRGRLRREGAFAGRNEPNLREYLDLVALGTIADVVPLLDENRIFVKHGLQELTAARRIGVRALKRVAGIDGEVGYGAVGFRLAPRLNAAGRLEDASRAVELLLATDEKRALSIAAELDGHNSERQDLERAILGEALAMLAQDPTAAARKSIVLAAADWHPGVIGIVASRLVEQFYRPTVLVALQDGEGKGSGRSIPAFHLHDALRECSGHLQRFGGHKHAAGLAVAEEAVAGFAARFEEVASRTLTADDLLPLLTIDAELAPAEVTAELAGLVGSLAPFGMGNPEPLFLLRGVTVLDRRILKEQHLKLRLEKDGCRFGAIGFNMASRGGAAGERVDLVAAVQWNEWQGRRELQLQLKDFRVAHEE